MRILICTINFSPELVGIGKYTGELAECLARRGHDIRVVTAPPYYPAWRVGAGYRAWMYRREEVQLPSGAGELIIYRCPLWVPSRLSGSRRIAHLASFALSSLPVMFAQAIWRPHVVLTLEPPLFCAPVAWMIARVARSRAWLHVQDFEIDAAFSLGIVRSAVLRSVLHRAERWLIKRFDRVSTISQRMLDVLSAKGIDRARAVLLPNWVDTVAIQPLEDVSDLARRFGIPSGKVVALYSGSLGEKQGLELLLLAAERLADYTGVVFVICGDGATKERLSRHFAHLANVVWLPLQPLEHLNDLLNLADLHLLPQRAEAADLVMPSKLTGMLASGRPVVATAANATEVAAIVDGCGVVVPPGDLHAFVEAIKMLAEQPQVRRRLGRAARERAIQMFDKVAIVAAFEAELLRVVTADGGRVN